MSQRHTGLDLASQEIISCLPSEVASLLGKTLYKIYKRDEYTHAFVVQCSTRESASALLPFKLQIFQLVSQIVETPVEGSIIFCANHAKKLPYCAKNCERYLGCINTTVKAMS